MVWLFDHIFPHSSSNNLKLTVTFIEPEERTTSNMCCFLFTKFLGSPNVLKKSQLCSSAFMACFKLLRKDSIFYKLTVRLMSTGKSNREEYGSWFPAKLGMAYPGTMWWGYSGATLFYCSIIRIRNFKYHCFISCRLSTSLYPPAPAPSLCHISHWC